MCMYIDFPMTEYLLIMNIEFFFLVLLMKLLISGWFLIHLLVTGSIIFEVIILTDTKAKLVLAMEVPLKES